MTKRSQTELRLQSYTGDSDGEVGTTKAVSILKALPVGFLKKTGRTIKPVAGKGARI